MVLAPGGHGRELARAPASQGTSCQALRSPCSELDAHSKEHLLGQPHGAQGMFGALNHCTSSAFPPGSMLLVWNMSLEQDSNTYLRQCKRYVSYRE